MKRNRNRLPLIILLLCAACNNNTAPKGQPIEQEEPTTNTAAPDSGEILFEAKCAACHGSDGTAGIANAANLKTSHLDSTKIIQTITKGRNGMPSFGSSIDSTDIIKLAGYVYSLRK